MEEQQLKRQLNMPIDIPHPWFQWMRGNGGVREPADLWLLQGMCYENNGQIKQNQGTVEWVQPIVFGIPVSAQEDFFEQITTRHNPDATLGPENNRFGDFCSPDHGRMLEVYKRTKGEGNKKKTEYRIRPGNSVPVAADHMAGLWMDWDKLIHIPTIEESIGQLIESFDGVAVDYALRESSYHDYVPEEFRGSSDNIMNADNIQDLRNARPKVGYQPPPGQGAPQAPPPPPPPPADDIPYNNAPPTPAPQAPAPPAAPQAAPPTPAPQAPAQAPPTPAPPTPAPAAPEQVPTVQGEVVDSTSMAPTAPPPGVDPAKFQGALEKMGQHQNNE
jgi:hypothetical protein